MRAVTTALISAVAIAGVFFTAVGVAAGGFAVVLIDLGVLLLLAAAGLWAFRLCYRRSMSPRRP